MLEVLNLIVFIVCVLTVNLAYFGNKVDCDLADFIPKMLSVLALSSSRLYLFTLYVLAFFGARPFSLENTN